MEKETKREQPGRARGSRNGVFVAATRFRRQSTASASVSVLNVPANRQTPPDRSLSDTLKLHRSPPRFQRIIAATEASAFFPFSLSKEARGRVGYNGFSSRSVFLRFASNELNEHDRAVISRRSNTRGKFKPRIFPP